MSLTASIIVSAARYALGRRSGVAQDIEDAVAANLDTFRQDHGCRQALIRDIRAHAVVGYGDRCDAESWARTLALLEGVAADEPVGRARQEQQ